MNFGKKVDRIDSLIRTLSGISLSDIGKTRIKVLVDRFGINEVYQSTIIAFDNYYDADDYDSFGEAFDKIGGVCYNRSIGRGADYYGY